jgi:cytochrome P450
MLAMHQDVQEKLVNELREVFSTADDPIDFDVLNNLPYLEMVIKETLRLFPISAFTLRTTSADFELENYVIPKDSILLLAVFAVQRNKKYWGEDAEKFIPERFEPDRIKNVDSYAFVPFSGKRHDS